VKNDVKRSRLTLGTALGSAVFAAASLALVSTSLADTFSFRVGSGHPVKGLSHMEALEYQFLPEVAKRIEERTDHKIKWIKAYSGSLVKLPETLGATQKGLIDIGVINYPHITELFVQNFPFYFPFQTGDAVMATKAVRATFDEVPWLTKSFEEKYNQKLLAIGANGNYGIGTTFPFEKFEDLKGKKVGAGGPNLLWFEGTGVAPVTTNLGEAYTGWKSWIYIGVVVFPGPYYGLKLHAVGTYFTVANFGSPSALSINMNLDRWNKLTQEVQDIFLEVSAEYEIHSSELANEADAKGLEHLKAAGTNIINLPVEEQAKWARGLAEYPNRQAEEATSRGAPGTEIFRTYIKNLKELGYQWPHEYQIK